MRHNYRRLTQAMQILSGAIMASSVLFSGAGAHDAPATAQLPDGWAYPIRCCWGPATGRTGDCGMIPASSVVEGPNGFEITLVPGEHPKVTAPLQLTVPYGKEEHSPDGAFHLCLTPDMKARCFFAGARGS